MLIKNHDAVIPIHLLLLLAGMQRKLVEKCIFRSLGSLLLP